MSSGDFVSGTISIQDLFVDNATSDHNISKQEQYEIDMEDLSQVFSRAEAVILSVYIGVLAIFGITANVTTFLVILRTPKLHDSVFNIFLMSLCVSDFFSSANSSLVLYRATWGFYEWSIPEIFCKLAVSVDFWTSCATIQHILLFAAIRLVSIKFPHKFGFIKPFHAKIAVTILWIESFGASFVVYFLWPGVFPPGGRTPSGALSKACTAQVEWLGVLMKYVQIGFPIVLYIPMVLVIVVTLMLCVLIVKRKRNALSKSTSEQTERKENMAFVQLTLIIASFMLGYLPDMAYRMTAVIVRSQNRSLTARAEWQFSITTHCLLRLSECLNPIFYNLGSSNMRKATRQFFSPIILNNGGESSQRAKSRTYPCN